ncbi:MAG: hypothetical protein CMI79_03090 [Candidatus Pelagibacter sp.]|nr:hypothetical protein [Candidatus Pelagibacter sp.]
MKKDQIIIWLFLNLFLKNRLNILLKILNQYLLVIFLVITLCQKKKIVITFDDGYKDNIINALPLLRKYNCPAIIYVTTGFLDNHNTAWWLKVWDIILNCKEIYFDKKKNKFKQYCREKKSLLFF